MKKLTITSLCNFVCAVLLLVTLVMQFQPFWTCEDCKSHKDTTKDVSIAEYFWLPRHHDELAEDMTDLYKEIYGNNYRDPNGKKFKFRANEVLATALAASVGSVAGILCCVLLRKKFWVSAIPLAVGIAGVLGFTTCPALQIGKNAQIHLIIAIVVTVVAAISLILGTILAIRAKKAAIAAKAAQASSEDR